MKTFHAAVLATLMTSTLAIGAIAPASAQDAPPTAQQHLAGHSFGPSPRPMHRGNGDILNFQRGAEGVEIALVRLAHRLDLTEEQKPLLDDLKAAALTAATNFEAAVKDLRPTPPAAPAQPVGADATAPKPPPAPPAPPAPDFSKNLDARIALGKANVAALEAIKPSYDAFFGSLSDEQKAKLTPSPRERGERGGRGGPQGQQGPKGHGPRH